MYSLYLGDCLSVMETLREHSVDAIVTDPPYGLSFMGKHWDHGVPGVRFWEAALRVIKPGGYLLAFGGTRTWHRLGVAIEDAGWEIRDTVAWIYGQGFPKSHNLKDEWAGWGTALKPALEPVIMARAPLSEHTVAANVLKWGTGAINVDGGRVGVSGEKIGTRSTGGFTSKNGIYHGDDEYKVTGRDYDATAGRWPANVIHDGSEAATAGFPQTTSGVAVRRNGNNGGGMFPVKIAVGSKDVGYNDPGSAARFFYCAKASKRDREEGLDGGRNIHATVKPTALMRYLCRLVTQPGGVVLDPFAGSGSTGKGAILEGFNFIGIELEAEYLEIARRRLDWAERQLKELELE